MIDIINAQILAGCANTSSNGFGPRTFSIRSRPERLAAARAIDGSSLCRTHVRYRHNRAVPRPREEFVAAIIVEDNERRTRGAAGEVACSPLGWYVRLDDGMNGMVAPAYEGHHSPEWVEPGGRRCVRAGRPVYQALRETCASNVMTLAYRDMVAAPPLHVDTSAVIGETLHLTGVWHTGSN